MSAESLKVAVVGLGRMGHSHAQHYLQSGGYTLQSICCRAHQVDESRHDYPDAECFTEFGQLLTSCNVDLVCIATHADTHEELARQAVAAGKHVFLEKPATRSFMSAQHLIEEAREKGVSLVVGYVLQHDRLWQAFCSLCREMRGPLHIDCALDQHSNGVEWALHRRILSGSSIAADCGIHYFDIFCEAIKSSPVSVSCEEQKTHDEPGLYANSTDVRVEFNNGSRARYRSAWGSGHAADPVTQVVCNGADGQLCIEFDEGAASLTQTKSGGARQEVLRVEQHLAKANAAQHDFVRAAIAQGSDLTDHYRRVLQSMRIAEVADLSSLAGELSML